MLISVRFVGSFVEEKGTRMEAQTQKKKKNSNYHKVVKYAIAIKGFAESFSICNKGPSICTLGSFNSLMIYRTYYAPPLSYKLWPNIIILDTHAQKHT